LLSLEKAVLASVLIDFPNIYATNATCRNIEPENEDGTRALLIINCSNEIPGHSNRDQSVCSNVTDVSEDDKIFKRPGSSVNVESAFPAKRFVLRIGKTFNSTE